MEYILENILLRSLKSDLAFEELFRASLRVQSDPILARIRHVYNNQSSDESRVVAESKQRIIGFAVQVSKKRVPSAVLRNRIKRLLRESLYLLCKSNPELFFGIERLALLWNSGTPVSTAALTLADVMLPVEEILKMARKRKVARVQEQRI